MTLLRASEDVSLVARGDDGAIVRDGVELAILPRAGPLVATLVGLLSRPREEGWLRAVLDRRHPPAGGELISTLVEQGALTSWPLGESLVELHERTTAGPLADPPPAAGDAAFLLREYHAERALELDASREPPGDLADALAARRTVRRFTADPIAVEDVSMLLRWGAGSARSRPLPHVAGGISGHRTYPSGGATYAAEPYLVALRVAGLESGAYRYQSLAHALAWSAQVPGHDALAEWLPYCPVEDLAAAIVLAVDWRRPSLARYGEKAYRLALLEAGHIGQGLVLVCAALGLGAMPLCGFADGPLSLALGLDHPHEAIVYAIAIGVAAAGSS